MRAVNLLPRDAEQARKGPQLPIVVGCAGAVLTAIVLAGGYLSASSKVGDENAKLAEVQAKIAAVPKPEPEAPTVSSLPQERQARVAALASALSQRVAWDRILREISLVLPEDVWLRTLSATAPGPTPSATATGITIEGFTYSQAAVARLLARLAVVPDLADVTLQSSTTADVGGRDIVSFTIAGNVRPTGAAS
jgi:Tfp pilus assembly protein PilN